MTQDDIKDKLKKAISEAFSLLKSEDGELFDCPAAKHEYNSRKLHEVAINHKLASHLETKILLILNGDGKEYSVDIEFNREGVNDKMLKVDAKEELVRPDIIIHNRKTGEGKNNFLVVECKKAGGAKSKIKDDENKLWAFLRDERYQYEFALQVIYEKGQIRGTLFFKNGQGISEENIEM